MRWLAAFRNSSSASMPIGLAGSGSEAASSRSEAASSAETWPFERSSARRSEVASLVKSCRDRKSTRLNSSHGYISYAVFCLKKKKKTQTQLREDITLDPQKHG